MLVSGIEHAAVRAQRDQAREQLGQALALLRSYRHEHRACRGARAGKDQVLDLRCSWCVVADRLLEG